MKEEIKNLDKMIEEYYKEKTGKDVVFDLMHVNVRYSYIVLNDPIYNLDYKRYRYRDVRERAEDTVIVPVIIEKSKYDEKYADDLYYEKREFTVKDEVFIGTCPNYDYDKIKEKIYEIMPEDCTILTEEELQKIARKNGYDNFEWETHDHSIGLPPIAYGGPDWRTTYYGVKELEEDYQLKL